MPIPYFLLLTRRWPALPPWSWRRSTRATMQTGRTARRRTRRRPAQAGWGAQAEAAGVGGYGRRHHHLDVLGPRRLARATGSVARRTRGTAGSPGRSASSTSAAAQPSSPNPAIRDLPPPVSPISIPRAHTFSFLLSVDFSAHPTDSPPAAHPRRRFPPVAAIALRAAPPLQLPSARPPGELCPVPDHAVRALGLCPASLAALLAGRRAALRRGLECRAMGAPWRRSRWHVGLGPHLSATSAPRVQNRRHVSSIPPKSISGYKLIWF